MNIYYKEEIPMLRILLFFMAGILILLKYNTIANQFLLFLYLLGWVLLIVSKYIILHKNDLKYAFLKGLLIAYLFVLSGALFCKQHIEIEHDTHFSKTKSDFLIVHLLDEPNRNQDIERFLVSVDGVIYNKKIAPVKGNLLLALRIKNPSQFHYGDELIIKSKFKEIEEAYNPAEFNFKKYLWYKKVYHQSFINELEIKKIGHNKGNFLKAFAIKFCLQQVQKFKIYITNKEAYSVASILILGYKTDLSTDLLQTYSKTGTIHILSVSGMHVAIIAIFLEFLLQFLNRKRILKICKVVLIISMVWFYALVAGLQPSVERSAIMISFFILGKLLFQQVNTFNILAVSALLILLHNPFAITDIGFQLSFIAVAGLLYFQPKIYGLLYFDNPILNSIWKYISVSLAAQLATAAISIYYFHQFPVYFIISNLFIAIPATLIMYIGIIFLVFPWPMLVMQYLSKALENCILFANNGLKLIENLPLASINQLQLSLIEIALFYVIILSFLKAYESKKIKFVAVSILASLVFIISITFAHLKFNKQNKLLFFSLRKNAAMVYIKGHSAVLLSDLNKDDKTYKFSVKPYLDSCKITSITFINPFKSSSNILYRFDQTSLFITNKYYPDKTTSYEYLCLNNHQIITLKDCIHPKLKHTFVLGTNKDYVLKAIKNQSELLSTSFTILKRNKAVEINL